MKHGDARHARVFDAATPQAGWALQAAPWRVQHNKHFEALFTLGSGYLNVRASLPEGLGADPQNVTYMRMPGNVTLEKFRPSKSKWGTYVPGFTDRHPLLNDQMVNLPSPLGCVIEANGERLDLECSSVRALTYWLDLHDGVVHRTFEWQLKRGVVLRVGMHMYAHLPRRHVLWQQIVIEAVRGSATVRVMPFLDADVRTNGYDHWQRCAVGGTSRGAMRVHVRTHGGKDAAVLAHVTGLPRWQVRTSARAVRLSGSARVTAATPLVCTRYVAVATAHDGAQPQQRAQRALAAAVRAGDTALYAEHSTLWAALWTRMDVQLDGDSLTQQALRGALYHLVRANPRTPHAGIDPKMNGGDAYWGRIFWDTEMFVAPFFLYALPELAQPLFAFRHVTLAGARRRAQAEGYRGARYPWESDMHGNENCPSFQYGDHEVHISSDVALGQWHYVCAANDRKYLADRAAEIIIEVARYWVTRVGHLPGSPHAHILCVMGPDEYMHAANDNAYTNYLAREVLAVAAEIVSDARGNAALAAVMKKLRVAPAEARTWCALAKKILVPYDAKRKLYLQSTDFERKAPIDFKKFWRDRTKLFGTQVSQERLYRVRALKQADVLLLMQLFCTRFTDEQVRAALAFYEPCTTHDSSLSVSNHAMIAARLGDLRKAWDYFKRARAMDFMPATFTAAEGIHAANAGALWQCVMFGFLGLQPAYLTPTLTLTPHLPAAWRAVCCSVTWRGTRVALLVCKTSVVVTPERALRVCVNGISKRCPTGSATMFA
jgi:kojibiose phosphorylase